MFHCMLSCIYKKAALVLPGSSTAVILPAVPPYRYSYFSQPLGLGVVVESINCYSGSYISEQQLLVTVVLGWFVFRFQGGPDPELLPYRPAIAEEKSRARHRSC